MEAQLTRMKSAVAGSFPLLPDFRTVLTGAKLLRNYYLLYLYHFHGNPLPENFPTHLVTQFPDNSYKGQLKNAISLQTFTVYGLINIQNQYLSDYYSLYTHYTKGVSLREDFPAVILRRFPNESYKKQLKSAIQTLQNEVNQEKEAM